MSGEEHIAQVKQALGIMYSNAPQAEKKQATNFLESYQKSQEAWTTFDSLLEDSNLQIKLFGAQTLRSKITYDLPQLPESSYVQLKNSLIELILRYPNQTDRLIRTQLCISLSQLALQYLSWSNAMDEIISKLSSNEIHIVCLLDFFKILPEELSDVKKTSLTDEEFNARTKQLISDNVDRVLLILKNLADKNSSANLNSYILGCLNSWIKECPIESILHVNSLTTLIFQSLTVEETFDQSIECLCTIMRETRDLENYELIDALYQQILQLHGYMSLNKEKLEDPETFSSLTRLYVEAGEAWHVLIAKNPLHFKPLVSILLECSKYEEDLDVVKYTFYFWYLLKQIIVLPKFQEPKLEFLQIYLDLIAVIVKHLTYPIDYADDNLFDGDKEQEDKFKEFRYEMGDVLKDCCAVAGARKSLEVPFSQVQHILSTSSQDAKWQYIEAPLFAMRAMAKEVPLKENSILPVIMKVLFQLPEHPKVRYAATLVLGRYTEWTSKNPEFLEPQLNYIIKGFQLPDLESSNDIIVAASHALMYFCQDCSELLVNYLEQLYMLYGQIKNQLDIESTYELADGIAHVIKKIPSENMFKATEMFLAPTMELLNNLLKNNDANDEATNINIADQIEVVSTFVRVLRCSEFEKPQYPIASFFIEKVWLTAHDLLSKFGKSLKVSERISKLIKCAIQSFSTYLSPVLPDIANVLHEGFKETRYGCFLWVSGILIREFGDEYANDDTKKAVYQFGLSQCSLFYDLLNSNCNPNDLPDVVEDFFRMMNDLLMFFPFDLISNLDVLKSTLTASVLTLNTVTEFDALISCLHFLIDFVSWGFPTPPISYFDENPNHIQASVKQFLLMDDNGQLLFKSVLEGLIFKFPNDVQPDANELLLKLLLVAPDAEIAITWVSRVANGLPNVSSREVNKLINTVHVALPNKDNRRVRSSIKDFVSWYSRRNVTPRSEF
ncbi:uncharacterized protein PRCAT00000962001 [Priceomyces carsonii]|uniref:uncharacterized protein n=1 Tax=Priceomyces carsonii TaxID=28549 RepID=UPI002EDA7B1F|nr:unnamed protein product [Priceomyces carsonii]